MIWLVGCGGMLGQEVRGLLQQRGSVHAATGREVDVTSEEATVRHAEALRPTWIINCAAYTAVDRAESEPIQAHAVNARGAQHLAAVAASHGAWLLHVSTDYVFGGRGGAPQTEDAPVGPLGVYGRTKAAGEDAIRAACPQHVIVRTSWLHGPLGHNFVGTMLRLMSERPEVRVVDDQHGRPTYARDLAEVIMALLDRRGQDCGTFHYANSGACTWYEFAREIQDQGAAAGILHHRVPVIPIPSSSYPTAAPRPAYSVLATNRIEDALGLTIPRWQDGLARHLERLRVEGSNA